MSQQMQQGSKPHLNLPGQSWVAAGPHSQSGMYIMHYAFRRTSCVEWMSHSKATSSTVPAAAPTRATVRP